MYQYSLEQNSKLRKLVDLISSLISRDRRSNFSFNFNPGNFFRGKFLALFIASQRVVPLSSRPTVASLNLVFPLLARRTANSQKANLEKLFNSRPVVARFYSA